MKVSSKNLIGFLWLNISGIKELFYLIMNQKLGRFCRIFVAEIKVHDTEVVYI